MIDPFTFQTPKPEVLGPQPVRVSRFGNSCFVFVLYLVFVNAETGTPINLRFSTMLVSTLKERNTLKNSVEIKGRSVVL